MKKMFITTLLALMACFSRQEAEEIGKACQGVDENATTDGKTYLTKQGDREQAEWHFPVQPPNENVTRADQGNNTAMQKYNNATTNKALGQSMHVIEDSFSHASYKAGWGHAGPDFLREKSLAALTAADKTANDVPKALDMAKFVYDKLTQYRNNQKPLNNPVEYDQNVETALKAIFSLTDTNQIIEQLKYWIDAEERTKNRRIINPGYWDTPPPEMHPPYYVV